MNANSESPLSLWLRLIIGLKTDHFLLQNQSHSISVNVVTIDLKEIINTDLKTVIS